ncbi:MAG: hypothetical protein JW928_02190 [Candidatus Aureabacteria bacterium]|nr:hypothetical protein [Candidatus Auribacterota bacterium]
MKIKHLSLILLFILPLSAFSQMKQLTLQEKIAMSDLVAIATVERTYKGKGDQEKLGNWFAKCTVSDVFKGKFVEEMLTVNFLNVRRNRAPIRLSEGAVYLLFLKKKGDVFEMISPYQGAYAKDNDYLVHDNEYPKGIRLNFEAIVERVKEITQ